MKYAQMFELSEEARLSPERLGEILGVSGMTLRRWKKSPPAGAVPKLYERAFAAGVQEMVTDGKVSPDSPLVRSILTEASTLSFQASLRAVGFTEEMFEGKGSPERLVEGLSRIGSLPKRIKEVEREKKKIFSFAKMGEDWGGRIRSLLMVIRSNELLAHKFVAYGALFYLLMPFDLIPDGIPVFGYLDDYVIRGFALAHYRKKFPRLFS